MKNYLIFLFVALFGLSASGQKNGEIVITKEIKTTAVKNQAMSNTCWSFAVLSFFESELLRMGKGEFDLSEMFYVRKAYPLKAYNYCHFDGKSNFGPGGQAHDIATLFLKYGAMPETSYSGLLNSKNHDQLAMDDELEALMKKVVKNESKKSNETWRYSIDSVLDLNLGRLPNAFVYQGQNYTPESFADSLGLDPSNYVELTSYSHHPFYSPFVLEVPDNWMYASYYNLPIDELMLVMDNAINMGYTICWDGDVTDDVSFLHNKGVATIANEKSKVTQNDRQKVFDNFSVTDDHLMHINGIGQSADGGKYYLTKNSWGNKKGNEGFWFMSENFVRLKTIAIMVHKDAIPAEIKMKLGIKM
jgi:bleomycin hydrolase